MQLQQYSLVSTDTVYSFGKGWCLPHFGVDFQNFKDSFGEIF